jgi:hypothetical protein
MQEIPSAAAFETYLFFRFGDHPFTVVTGRLKTSHRGAVQTQPV